MSYPQRKEQYHGLEVTLYEIGGKEFITAEDIGRCLGLIEPRKKVNQIYNRNRDELSPHRSVLNLRTEAGLRETIVFSETGANLIGMFSRSPKAKDFRLWLARLPGRVRSLANGQAVQQAYRLGLKDGRVRTRRQLLFFTGGLDEGLVDEAALYFRLRRQELTQREAALIMGKNRDQVQQLEYRLEALGLKFGEVRGNRRKKEMRRELFAALGWPEEEAQEDPKARLGTGGAPRGVKALPEPGHAPVSES